MTTELENELRAQGYKDLVEIPDRGVCGIMNFIFTKGLCYGLDEDGYEGRYCYESIMEAKADLSEWDGIVDPPGNWIKHKGYREYSNPNYKK